jgi:hypothetical protein
MKPRLRHGLPRGGVGYLGIPVGIAAVIGAWRFDGSYTLATATIAAPLCLWLGLGLRADGQCGEAADEVVSESPRRYDWLRVEDNVCTVFRLSTCIILLGLTSLTLALLNHTRFLMNLKTLNVR